ncbi:hypothetical protein H4582DRAFT_1939873 [Lactarius indigo]|nr:hypothetical protein H4582DRAFT_1939873 [Lactarius indigo]
MRDSVRGVCYIWFSGQRTVTTPRSNLLIFIFGWCLHTVELDPISALDFLNGAIAGAPGDSNLTWVTTVRNGKLERERSTDTRHPIQKVKYRFQNPLLNI